MLSLNKKRKRVQVQVKGWDDDKSKSFTLYDCDLDEVFNRIYFLFEELEKSNGGVRIFHHK